MNSNFNLLNLFFTTIIQMYIILNPPSVIAIMLGLTKQNTVEERLNISKQVCIFGGILLFLFGIFGQIILDDIFHISPEAFQVGGGFYLFTVGLSMISSKSSNEEENSDRKNAFNFVITPLATPLLTGPGTITAVLVKRTELPSSFSCMFAFYSALLVTFALVYLSFYMGCKFSRYFTPLILKIIEKLVGVLLTCIAVNSILKGITTFLHHL